MIFEVCLILLTVYIISFIFKPKGNQPPGPRGLPILGTLPYGQVKECSEARKKYGNVFMTKTGVVKIIYICDYKLTKESFSKTEFADRPEWKALSLFGQEIKEDKVTGVIFSNSHHWVHNRRFLLRHLRDLGMGKSKIEGKIMMEVEELVQDFKNLTKEPSKLPFSINISILNIIWQLVAGQRYDFTDKSVEHLMEMFNEFQAFFMITAIPDFYPFLEYILPRRVLNYLVNEHLKTLDPNNPRDLMDDYLIEMKEKKNQDYSHFDFTDLTRITFDLFMAGNDTTANMTRWFLVYMARFQEIQEKVQEEIDRVVPRDTLPGLQHRNELAYLDATINEVQRCSSMIPFGVARRTTTDLKLGGYDIPMVNTFY
ncbi:Cytochrome P450 2C13, male-specific [Armadillidium nasatum]|uniref:Cytochrome P450 2C13, male-specific n=1 Tax=Armadillidium nasatum TaxID=96803 RepID=A0A5N5SJM1_9CRUS|nr:Cytochrome P450 2C13, male-specific [Armadillidium nasatum]